MLFFILIAMLVSFGGYFYSIRKYRTFFLSKKDALTEKAMNLSIFQISFQKLNSKGIDDVRFELTKERNGYSNKKRAIFLSENIVNKKNTLSITVACHEACHAAQYQEGYLPIQIREKLYKIIFILSNFVFLPLFFSSFFTLTLVDDAIALFLYLMLVAYNLLIVVRSESNANLRCSSFIKESQFLNLIGEKEMNSIQRNQIFNYVMGSFLLFPIK